MAEPKPRRNFKKNCSQCGEPGVHSWGLCYRCYVATPEFKRIKLAAHLKIHNMTVEQYEQLLIEQNGGCAICGGQPTNGKNRLSVDHNHKTNKNRGLLCDCCNRAIGLMKDSPELLRLAAAYLQRHGDQNGGK